MSNKTMSNKVVLVTGASSGIGEATARRLAAAGHRVFLGARREERLAALAGELGAGYRRLDVTSRESVDAFVAAAVAAYGRVDVLVNNAGVMPLSALAELRVAEWEQMVDVNLRGVLYGIAAVLPVMRAQGGGHVVNLASTSGHRVDPTAAVYCATKAGVLALSEGLRQESRDIRVTVVTPGLTRSELAEGITDPVVRDGVRDMMKLAIPADAIAEGIAYAIGQPPDVDVNEIVIRPTAQG